MNGPGRIPAPSLLLVGIFIRIMKKTSTSSGTMTLPERIICSLLFIFVFGGLGFGLYFGNLDNQFVYTDTQLLERAQQVNAGKDPYKGENNSVNIFSGWNDKNPVAAWSFLSWQRQVFQNRPFEYHFLQLCLHLFCSAVIYSVFLLILKCAKSGEGGDESPRPELYALAAAALFLCHPVCAAGSSWLSAQKYLLSALFLLICTGFFMHDTLRQKQRVSLSYAISVFFYAISVFTGTISGLWFLVLGVHARFAVPASANRTERLGRTAKLIPFLLLSTLSFLIYFYNKSLGGISEPGAFDFPASLSFAADYLKSALYPFGLTVVLLHKASHGISMGSILGAVFLSSAFIFCIVSLILKRFYIPCLACAWLLSATIPHSLEIREYMTDIRPYLISALIPLIFISCVFYFRSSRYLRMIVFLFLITIIPLFCSFSAKMSQNFQNGVIFWKQAVVAYPQEGQCWFALGTELTIFGDFNRAERAFQKSLEIEPKNPYFNRGLIKFYLRANKPGQAEKTIDYIYHQFPDEVDIQKDIWFDYYLVGNYYLKSKKYIAAIRNFNEVIYRNPTYPYAQTGIAFAFMKMGDYYNAYKASAIAAELAPDSKEIRKSRDYVLKKARENGYNFEIKGITKPFFDLLNKKRPGPDSNSRNKK